MSLWLLATALNSLNLQSQSPKLIIIFTCSPVQIRKAVTSLANALDDQTGISINKYEFTSNL